MSYKLKYLKYKTKYLKLKNMHGGNFTEIINKLHRTYKVELSENEKNMLEAEYNRNKKLTEYEMFNILFSFRDIQKPHTTFPSLKNPNMFPSLKPPKHTSLLERNLSRTSTRLPIIQQPLTFPSLTNSKDKQLSHSDEGSLLSSQRKQTTHKKKTSSATTRNIRKETVSTIPNNGQYISNGTTYYNTCMYLSIIYALKFLGIVNEVTVEELRLLGGLNPIPDNQEWDYANEADNRTLEAICRKYYISIDIYTLYEENRHQFYYHALTITPPKQGHEDPTPVRIAHKFVHFEVITSMPGYNIRDTPKKEPTEEISRVDTPHAEQSTQLHTHKQYEDVSSTPRDHFKQYTYENVLSTPRNSFKQQFYNAIVDNLFLTEEQEKYKHIKEQIVNSIYRISKLKEELVNLEHILGESNINKSDYTKEHITYVKSEIKRIETNIIQFEGTLSIYMQEETDFLASVS